MSGIESGLGSQAVRLPANSDLPQRHGQTHADAPRWTRELEFSREKISFALVIGASGQLVAIETLPNYPLIKRAEKLMTVPQARSGPNGPIANFLWDRTTIALGIGKDLRTACGYRIQHEAFACFRTLHAVALEGITDTALQAFLKFLGQWSPEQFLGAPDFGEKLDLNLVFRFQYDDEFLHERHAACVAWKRISATLRASPVAQQSQVFASPARATLPGGNTR